ncbi:MAG: amidase family protein [Rhodospirillaceae bacterium]
MTESKPASHEASRRDILKAAAWAAPVAAAISHITPAAAQSVALTELTSVEAIDRVKKGEMKAEDYLNALLDHHDTHKNLNSIWHIDRERIRAEARAVDVARAKGESLGLLAGLPFVVKDQIDVAGYPTTVGSPVLKGYVARKNAVVIDAMLKQGAVMMAKAAMSDLLTGGNGRYFPVVRNPYDLNRLTGSSSTGNGAAIAGRIAPAGIGEDSAGSVRYPAAFCGIAGLRPSTFAFDNYFNKTDRKRYSGDGMVPPTNWMDTMGPMGRTVADVALLDTAITGEKTPPVSLRKVRIGIPRADYWDKRPHDPVVRKVIEDGFAKIRAAGASLVEVDYNGLVELSAQDRLGPIVTRVQKPMSEWLAENFPDATEDDIEEARRLHGFIPEPVNYWRPSGKPPARPEPTGSEENAMMQHAWMKYSGVFKDNGITALASPTINILPPLIKHDLNTRETRILVNDKWVEEWDLVLTNIWWGSRFGAPALSLPVALASNTTPNPSGSFALDMPVGMQLQGMPGADTQILGIGIEVEKLFGRLPPPTYKHVPV